MGLAVDVQSEFLAHDGQSSRGKHPAGAVRRSFDYARDLPDDRYKSDLNGSDLLVPMKA
jgi:hypothetical protein